MNRRLVITIVSIVLLASSVVPIELTKASVDNFVVSNLLANGDFESGYYLPYNWFPDSWAPGAEFTWDNTESYQGIRSIKISASVPNNTRWIQGVSVQPNTDYKLSGWIKTDNVAHTTGSVDAGANLSIYGTWERTPAIIGTNEWTHVNMTFNTGSSSQIIIAARLGYWSGTTTGTAWFDEVKLEALNPPPTPDHIVFLPLISNSPCTSSSPSWKILALVYETTDFTFIDSEGEERHFVSSMTQFEKDKVASAVTQFVDIDIPALNSCNMSPSLTIRFPAHALSELSPAVCNDYAPSPSDTAPDRDPAFDSIIVLWDGSGVDLMTGQSMTIQGCSYAWGMGTGQTYDAIYIDNVQYTDRNVLKHEWGHSILFYYDAAGTAPRPPVDNHINNTTNRYVNCFTGDPYILVDETDLNPIPNSIYNNYSGFTHDYYSGQAATADEPTRCLGITPNAWASGGPVSGPISTASDAYRSWRNPSDDVISIAVPYSE